MNTPNKDEFVTTMVTASTKIHEAQQAIIDIMALFADPETKAKYNQYRQQSYTSLSNADKEQYFVIEEIIVASAPNALLDVYMLTNTAFNNLTQGSWHRPFTETQER